MVNIGFIVGKSVDEYPYKTTSRKAPTWLKSEKKFFKEFINDDNTVPSDVAMAMYLSYKHPYDVIECLFTDDLTVDELNDYDVIFVIYDPIEVFHCGESKRKPTCPTLAKKFERMLKETTAFVYPYPEFHKYIIVKPSYYSDLQRAGLPVAPFFKITPETALKSITKFRKRVENKGWEGIIIKPSYAGYSLGIKVFKNVERTKNKTFRKHFKKFQELGFPNVTVQKFVRSFGENFEIRTYWIDGKYACAVATLTKGLDTSGEGLPVDDFDTFESEGGNISDDIKKNLIRLGKRVISRILKYKYGHPMVRIDFGCCLSDTNCKEDVYFINEVETMAANMLATHTDFPIVEKTADAVYRFSKRVINKKKVKGRRSRKPAYKRSICVKPK